MKHALPLATQSVNGPASCENLKDVSNVSEQGTLLVSTPLIKSVCVNHGVSAITSDYHLTKTRNNKCC
eukprot:1625042-Amphidinium_carterae.1